VISSRRKRLGQHMLVDSKVLEKILCAAEISKGETVCEVGTGLGILTADLCKRARKVISFEVDRDLHRKALQDLQHENLELVSGDAFKSDGVKFDVFVSNLPYSRSRDAMEWLATQRFDRGIIMVQKEFADKLTASPGSKEYRAISALAGHCFKITHITKVGRKSFSPQPLVESVVVKLLPVNVVSKQTIQGLNLLFSKRNKKASSVAAGSGVSGYAGEKRIDQLPPSALVEMAERLNDIRTL
jgi:16S rRNA (adenine1518-N6/adenine1519-N6)-dimethyltransferase